MSLLGGFSGIRRSAGASALLAAALLLPGAPAAAADKVRFPDVEVRSLLASKDVRLPAELAGKPSLVLLTDGTLPADCPAMQAAVGLQRDYATWYTWAAVLNGPLTAAELTRFREASPVYFNRIYLDRQGLAQAALGVGRLPALLLVDEAGAILASCPADGAAAELEQTARTLWDLAGPARWRNAGFEDFRLPQIGAPGLVSFLDVAGQDGTLLAFVNSRCLACARELEVLDFIRQRRGGRVSFVTVFIDPAPEKRIRGFLAAAGAAPDFVLRDPELRLAERYAIRSAPAVLVIDTLGAIKLSRLGYREAEREEIYAALSTALDDAATPDAARSAVAEARRLHEEACAFMREGKPGYALFYQERIRELLPDYTSVHLRIAEAALADGQRDVALASLTRYLALEPRTYDTPAVRTMIAGLTAPAP
jgi:hypothetical protein